MTESVPQAQIDAARAYEALFVPALTRQWAPAVLDAARIGAGHHVLDVACGTGVLAREAVRRVGLAGSVTALDPNPGMLAVGRQLAPEVVWKEGHAESLPLADHSCDAVVSQFGLMFFADRRQALREMWRTLAPGGRFAFAVWDALEAMPAYAAEVALVEQLAGPQAADAIRAPFVLGSRRELEALFDDAGAGAVEIATYQGTARFPSIRLMVEADLRGWLPVMGVTLPEALILQILDAAEETLAPHVRNTDAAEFVISAHIVAGGKP